MTQILQWHDGPALPEITLADGLPDVQAAVSEAPDARVVFLRDGKAAAYAAIWLKQVPAHLEHCLGTIGGFAALDEAAAHAVLAAATQRLREQGCDLAVGPMNGNTWRSHRFATWSNGRGTYLLEPRQPEAYPQWWQGAGFAPLSQYSSSAFRLDGHRTVPAKIVQRIAREGIVMRPLNPAGFVDDLRAIHALSLEAFADNFLYTPLAADEFIGAYSKVRDRMDPALVLLAEQQGRVVGFVFALPDLEAAARGENPALIVKTLAVAASVRHHGLGSLLVDEVQAIAHGKGYSEAIHAMQHESNSSRRITGRHQGEVFRRYTLFQKPL